MKHDIEMRATEYGHRVDCSCGYSERFRGPSITAFIAAHQRMTNHLFETQLLASNWVGEGL